MNISTVESKMYMIYGNYTNHPMQAVERRLNKIISRTPHLINSVNRSRIHPLIRK